MTGKPTLLSLELASGAPAQTLEQADAPVIDAATEAVIAHMVSTQTETLTTEIASLRDQLALVTADRDAQAQALVDFRTETEQAAARAELAAARVAEVAAAAPALVISDAHRERFGRLSDVEFASYLADIAAAAGSSGEGSQETTSFSEGAGETAMSRTPKVAATNKAPGRALLGLRN